LGALKELLEQSPSVLKKGGRLAIISFHSLEDRLVKNYFKRGAFEEIESHPFENNPVQHQLIPVTKKPVLPGKEECKMNPRAGSAKLRVAEKL